MQKNLNRIIRDTRHAQDPIGQYVAILRYTNNKDVDIEFADEMLERAKNGQTGDRERILVELGQHQIKHKGDAFDKLATELIALLPKQAEDVRTKILINLTMVFKEFGLEHRKTGGEAIVSATKTLTDPSARDLIFRSLSHHVGILDRSQISSGNPSCATLRELDRVATQLRSVPAAQNRTEPRFFESMALRGRTFLRSAATFFRRPLSALGLD